MERPDAWHEVMPGVRRRILAHERQLTLVLYEIAPASRFPRHSHPHVQAGTFLRGRGRFTVGAETWEMRAGGSYLIPSNVPHELVTEGDEPTVVLDVFTPGREDFEAEALPPEP